MLFLCAYLSSGNDSAQAFWGLISDHSTARWGRRRPFILGGTLADLVFIAAIGLCGTMGLSGLGGYWLLFAAYVLLEISFNAGQGAAQGLIPDNVPENRLGRASAVKAVLEVPLPVNPGVVCGRAADRRG
jgi:MFS family permease